MKLFECRFNGKQYTVWFGLSEGEDVMNGAGIHDILCSFGFPPKTHLDFERGFHMRYTFPLGTTEEKVKEVRNAVEALPLICFLTWRQPAPCSLEGESRKC